MFKLSGWLRSLIIVLVLAAGWPTAGLAGTARVVVESGSAPIAFAGEEVRLALQQKGWEVSAQPSVNAVTIILTNPDGKGDAESFDVTTSKGNGSLIVRVRGKDERGVMYGGLDVAEQILSGRAPTAIEC